MEKDLVLKNLFSNDFLKAVYFPAIHHKNPRISLSSSVFKRMRMQLNEIMDYLHAFNPLKVEAALLVFSLILIDLNFSLGDRRKLVDGYSKSELIVLKFFQLLSENYKKEKTIDFYAKKLNISKVYLSKIVKKITGLTVIGNIERSLLSESERLLINTNLTIKTISELLGFSDQAGYTKFFKRFRNVSPSQYREKIAIY